MIADEPMVIAISATRATPSACRSTSTACRAAAAIGVRGMDLKEDDPIEHLFVASAHDYLLFFTSVGKVYRRKVASYRTAAATGKGRAL